MSVGRLKLVELLVVDRWVRAGVAERLQESRAPVLNAVGPHRIGGHLRLLQSTVSTVLARFRVPLCGHIDVNTGLTVRKPKPLRYEPANPRDPVPIGVKKHRREETSA